MRRTLNIKAETKAEYQRKRRSIVKGMMGGETLTRAEREIMEQVCKGYRAKEIAAMRNASPRTVHAQLQAIRLKLRCHTTTAAALEYAERKRFGTL